MKNRIYFLTLALSASSLTFATEMMPFEGGKVPLNLNAGMEIYKTDGSLTENEKDLKIINLNKTLEQQQRMYEEKITYLEDELQKSKDRLVEKSINHDKAQEFLEKRFAEETGYLKKELVAKTKSMMEFQRQAEKIKPSDDMKNLIKINTELALELRKSTDDAAFTKLKGENFAKSIEKLPSSGGRMPASVDK